MEARDDLVCPRCGEPAGQNEYCQTCGLRLWEQAELPTRGEWEARRAASPGRSPSDGLPDQLRVRLRRLRAPRAVAAITIGALLSAALAAFSLLDKADQIPFCCSLGRDQPPPLSTRELEQSMGSEFKSRAPIGDPLVDVSIRGVSCTELIGGSECTVRSEVFGSPESEVTGSPDIYEIEYEVDVEGRCWSARASRLSITLALGGHASGPSPGNRRISDCVP